MKRILLSLATLGVTGIVVYAGTTAFFSDTETSTDNTFTAGSIDLKIDSDCHYFQNGQDIGCNYYPNPSASPVPFGEWNSTDLTEEKFFMFTDTKPGDYGENTISLTVDNNPSWVCAQIDVTADDDVTCTDPETDGDDAECSTDTGLFNGDMRANLSFAWWADDGDNILEPEETSTLFFQSGVKLIDLLTLAGGNALNLTLADSTQNFFTHTANTPIEGATTKYIGLSWCFGDMNINMDSGAITCDGAPVDNASQTDTLTADLKFETVQARNNSTFTCADSFK